MAKKGLYANIHAKRKRGEKMRKAGDPGAPSAQDFKDAAKTAKAYGGMKMKNYAGGGKMLKYSKGGEFGMLSVKAGYDNNPKATAADRIIGAKKNKAKYGMKMKNKAMHGMKMKYGHGGRMQHD